MKLSETQKQSIREHLNSYSGDTQCPICRNLRFEVGDATISFPYEGNKQKELLLVPFSCRVCHNTQLIDVTDLF